MNRAEDKIDCFVFLEKFKELVRFEQKMLTVDNFKVLLLQVSVIGEFILYGYRFKFYIKNNTNLKWS
jgi:hypothetical protein